jgi:hypothetical protein
MRDYPRLAHLMDSYFHQDYDIDGHTIEEVVGAYQAVTPRERQEELAAEIETFLKTSPDVDRAFEERFSPQIETTDFAASTREFLEKIAAMMRAKRG